MARTFTQKTGICLPGVKVKQVELPVFPKPVVLLLNVFRPGSTFDVHHLRLNRNEMIRSIMDYVFDLNNKNWPAVDTPKIEAGQITVTMAEFGFRALTRQDQGIGKAILSGNTYHIQLPGEVVDPTNFTVSFKLKES
ncbi:MAG: hypothetical protein C0523_07415 [Cytophaga sp.]|nr:hypothetical protein [Cytophaga sp.]